MQQEINIESNAMRTQIRQDKNCDSSWLSPALLIVYFAEPVLGRDGNLPQSFLLAKRSLLGQSRDNDLPFRIQSLPMDLSAQVSE